MSGPEGQVRAMQGEALIRALELAGGVQPELVELAPADALAAREAALEQARDELGRELDQDLPPQVRKGGPEL